MLDLAQRYVYYLLMECYARIGLHSKDGGAGDHSEICGDKCRESSCYLTGLIRTDCQHG